MSTDDNLLTCRKCGTKNRFPIKAVGAIRCGKCGTVLAELADGERPALPIRAAWRQRERTRVRVGLFVAGALVVGGGALWVAGPRARDSSQHAPTATTSDMPKSQAMAPPVDLSAYGAPANPRAEQRCLHPPRNADILKGYANLRSDGHTLEIQNGTEGDAIVKVRDASTKRLAFSFFVAQSSLASLKGIPDGTYRIQFAFGDALNRSCQNFVSLTGASEFPASERLYAEKTADHLSTAVVSFTLFPVSKGNVRADPMDTLAFESD